MNSFMSKNEDALDGGFIIGEQSNTILRHRTEREYIFKRGGSKLI